MYRVGIPIVILREDEKRFFPWEYDQWRANKVPVAEVKRVVLYLIATTHMHTIAMQVWDKEQQAFVSVNQNATEWRQLPDPTGTGTVWINTRTKKYQNVAPAAIKAVASGSRVVQGPYDAMASGDALLARKLIEEHRDKMLTIRRRDFEVGELWL